MANNDIRNEEKLHLTKEERDELIRIMEEAAHRPVSKFYTLGDEWSEAYGFQESYQSKLQRQKQMDKEQEYMDYEETEAAEEAAVQEYSDSIFDSISSMKKRGAYPPVDKLSEDAQRAITTAFQTDDAQLREWGLLLGMASMRFYIIAMLPKYTSSKQEQQDFISSACVVLTTEIPHYDYKQGALTTFLDRRLTKALGIERFQQDHVEGSRHYADIGQKIKKAVAALEQDGITDPSPVEISAWIDLHLGKKVSEQSVINYQSQNHGFSSYEETVKYLDETSDTFSNPETAYVQNETKDEIHDWIDSLDPIRRRIFTLRMEAFETTGHDLSIEVLTKRMKEYKPSLTRTDIKKHKQSADQAMLTRFRANFSRESVAANGVSVGGSFLEAEAKSVCESIQESNLDDIF